ncbi:uncharacterized protein G2W53_032950 [Senna tora]|uniref:Uncharacterized protein n=1 Tax=Senna tora TaxID=362788 RepID=A0A834SXK7_9FABA|nr:uncharacterized protein G2W53_032950 [Senna tora]
MELEYTKEAAELVTVHDREED